jgi:hypothetical protein
MPRHQRLREYVYLSTTGLREVTGSEPVPAGATQTRSWKWPARRPAAYLTLTRESLYGSNGELAASALQALGAELKEPSAAAAGDWLHATVRLSVSRLPVTAQRGLPRVLFAHGRQELPGRGQVLLALAGPAGDDYAHDGEAGPVSPAEMAQLIRAAAVAADGAWGHAPGELTRAAAAAGTAPDPQAAACGLARQVSDCLRQSLDDAAPLEVLARILVTCEDAGGVTLLGVPLWIRRPSTRRASAAIS